MFYADFDQFWCKYSCHKNASRENEFKEKYQVRATIPL